MKNTIKSQSVFTMLTLAVLGTAIYTLGVSKSAHAACTTKEEISAMNFDHGINKGQLSERDKCWLDVHASGKDIFGYDKPNHGVSANIFWIRVGGEYYSTALKNLSTKAARDAWLGSIKADVSQSFDNINSLNDDVQSLTKTIETIKLVVDDTALNILKAQLDAKQSLLDAEIAKVASLVIDKDALTADKLALNGQITDLNGQISDLEGQITSLEAEVTQLKLDVTNAKINSYNDGHVAGTMAANAANQLYVEGLVSDHVEAIAAKDAEILTLNTQVSNLIVSKNAIQAIMDGMAESDKAAIIEAAKKNAKSTGFYINGSANEDRNGYNNAIGNTNADEIATVTTGTVEINGKSYIENDHYDWNIADIANEWDLKVSLQDVTRAIEDAYNDGYDNGYNDGYSDGYADGFADGVDSVK